MTNRQNRSALNESPSVGWRLRGAMLAVFLTVLLTCSFLWFIPMEVAQQWAIDRAGSGAFDRFEAAGKTEFSLWQFRIATTILLAAIGFLWSRIAVCADFVGGIWRGLIVLTQSPGDAGSPNSTTIVARMRRLGCRGILLAWMLLFAVHGVHAIGRAAHDWPYFRFNSGDVVLPNISVSNRAVIRYLQASTPPDARILVASDQKLFFLSYYLRPRTLLHRMHPDSEHVIPMKDQERKLNAYRLDELTADDLRQMPHDYTLEYFEHPDLVDPSKLLSDSAWISFIRKREQNPLLIPSYVVTLKKSGETQ